MLKTKANEPCLAKAAGDEPIWVLRGQDLLTPRIIRAWAAEAEKQGVPRAKVEQALEDARDLEVWQYANPGRVRLPD